MNASSAPRASPSQGSFVTRPAICHVNRKMHADTSNRPPTVIFRSACDNQALQRSR